MKIWQALFFAILVPGLACTQTTTSESGGGEQVLIATKRALPSIGGGGTGTCVEEASTGYYRPSLEAWSQVADSIFVGTIRSVTKNSGPVYHVDSNEFRGEIDPADCPVPVFYGVVMEFEDVETLRGEQLGDTMRLELSHKLLESLQVSFDEASQNLVDWQGNHVYFPGARIGSALFTANTGHKFWAYSQFEVFNDTVYLQPTNEEDRCWTSPYVLAIPPSLDGISFTEFVQALDAATDQVDADALDHIERHKTFVAVERNAATFGNICSHGPIARPDADPAVKNDTNL